MHYFSFFIAWRYLRHTAYNNTTSTMVRICFFSIMIGSFSLCLVTAIMHGFEKTTHTAMQGIHAQAIIRAPDDASLDLESIGSVLKNEFPMINAYSPSTIEHALLFVEKHEGSPAMVMIKGIDPLSESRVSTIAHKIISAPYTPDILSTMLTNDTILIGKTLAKDYGLSVGDEVILFFTDDIQPTTRTVILNSIRTHIGGIFNTGIDEFDSTLIFCSLNFLQKLFPSVGITQLNITLEPSANEQEIIRTLRNRLHLDVYSWKEVYPALVSALTLEKYVMFCILVLIILVASMNMMALLFTYVTYKRSDIAILKAMGVSEQTITSIFFLLGLIITISASITGIVCAYIASWLLQRYPIQLPDIYYVSHIPAIMDWRIAIIVLCTIVIINIGAIWIPVRRTHAIRIAHVLRFEG